MIELRPAKPEEYLTIGNLTAEAYLADGALPPGDPYYDVLRDAGDRAVDADLWVAVDDGGTLLGTVTWCPVGSSYRELGGADEGEFRALAVAPSGQRRGVGELLVRRCLELATESGAGSVVISTGDWAAPAHRLYGRLGFVRAPERDWWPRPGLRLLAFVHPLA